jgi:hypothetical protein
VTRRVPSLVVVLVSLVAIVLVGRTTPAEVTPVFSAVATEWMPAAPSPGGLTGTWFCPGVPATGEDGVGGELVVSNRESRTLVVQVELLSESGATSSQSVTVAPWARTVIDVDAALGGQFVSAVVEIEGGGGIVEQRAIHPAGTAVSPCANSTSASWYLADGFTVGGSRNQIVLTNPYDDTVIVDIGFATSEGSRTPAAYQGFPIQPRSVAVIDFGAPGAGAQGEEQLAVKVEATRGQLVVGRSQHFVDGGRLGYTMTLAAPAPRDQWWFADGEKGPNVDEVFSLYNPTDDDVEVDAVFLGISEFAEVDPILVPARQVVAFEPGTVPSLVEGRHAVVFSTAALPSIVVERALTRISDGEPSTSVLLGAPPRADSYVASTWHLAIGPDAASDDALVVFNVDNASATIAVDVIADGGAVPVAGLEAIEVGPASVVTIDLPADVVGRELQVRSSSRIFVERSLPSGQGAGRNASWALPAG